MELVTVFRTLNQTEAQLVCSRLEAADFHPFIANEYTATWLSIAYPTLLRVEVPEAEAAEAESFLAAPAG